MAIAPSPIVGPVEDFEARTWREALRNFQMNSGHKEMMDDFLRKTTTPSIVAQTCREKQRDASSQYGKILGKILGKIDIFISVGNLAVKGAPESVGLAWTGIQMALHSVQDDFATFQLFSGACMDIIGILITCRLFGRMFGEKNGPAELREIQDQVTDAIPKVYGNILEFSYRMYKFMGTSSLLRITKGLFQAQKNKFEGLIGGVKDGEKSMSEYATKASQALQLWYAKKSDKTQDKVVSDLAFIKEKIDDNASSSRELADFVRKELEASRKRTPMDVARDAFNSYQRQLRMIDHAPQLEKRKQAREPGTCTWMFDAEEYKNWHDSEGNKFLWMSGGGNMGKSYLVSAVIERLQAEENENNDMFVQYFFCKNGDNDAQKTDRILSQIIGWLYASTPPTLETMDRCNDVVRRYLQKLSSSAGGSSTGKKDDKDADAGEKGLPFEEAYALLAAALRKKVFLIVDALDEVADRQDQEFIQQLMKVHSQPAAQNVKVFVSSRPENDITKILGGLGKESRIRVEEFNEKDIKRAVTQQVEHIPGMSPSEREEAIKIISERAGSYFGYVNPALTLLRMPWQRPLRKHLERLPETVSDMNMKILTDTDPRYLEFLKTCLKFMIFANGNQKVTIEEVVDAYSKVYTADLDWSGEELENESEIEFYRKQIQEAGDAFIDVNEKSKELSLIKPAIVKDAFVKPEKKVDPEHDTNTCEECRNRRKTEKVFVLTEKGGHLEIAKTIFEHLNSSTFARRFLPWVEEEEETKESTNEKAEDPNGETTQNADEAEAQKEDGAPIAIEASPSQNDAGQANGLQSTTQDSQTEVQDLQVNGVASNDNQPGEETTVNGVPDGAIVTTPPADSGKELEEPHDDDDDDDVQSEGDSDIDATDWNEFLPLEDNPEEHMRYEILQCIYHLQQAELEWSRDGPSTSEEYEALLSEAEKFFRADNPSFKAWKKKIQYKLELTYREAQLPSLTPLHCTATFGLYDLSKRLVDRGDAVDVKTNVGRRPLHCAANVPGSGPIKNRLCKLLLEKGADPNWEARLAKPRQYDPPEGEWFESPFTAMLYYGCDKDLLQLFFDHGADGSQTDFWGMTTLHNFAFVGTDREVLAMLLEHGGDIKGVDDRGETALHKLLDRAEFPIGILEDFIKAGAEINKDNTDSAQPLFEVASSGNLEAARMMLDHGADVHDDDNDGWTALHMAASRGDEKMAALLVERGADPTRGDKRGRTPFFLACENGEITTARYLGNLLSEKDPSLLDKPSDNGKTPFRKACGKSHVEVVRLLLTEMDAQIDINATDKKLRRNAVHMAAYNGSDEILELLLSHGAEAQLLDRRGHTPLRLCYENWGIRAAHDPNNDGFEKCLVRLIDLDRHAAVEDQDLLSTATRKGSVTILKHLLEAEPRADPNNRDQDGWTAVEIARQYRQSDAEKVLSESGVIVGKMPSGWVTTSAKRISVDENGTTASFVSDANNMDARFSVLSDRPIPAGLKRYYYEVTISLPDDRSEDDQPAEIAMGICHREYAAKTFQGWVPGHSRRHMTGSFSWGYHGDDGYVRTSSSIWSRERDKFEGFGDGDVVGCGVDLEKGTVFWTKNGKRLMNKAFEGVSGRLYPVWGASDKCSIETNFSNGNFVWKSANNLDFDSDVPVLIRSRTMKSMDG